MTLLLILLALLTLVTVSLQRTYANLPLKELKHRARKGDEIAKALVKAVGYGHTLKAVLWFLVGLSAAGFFVLVAQTAPTWFAFMSSGALVWLGFVWLPASKVSHFSEKAAAWLAPILSKVLFYLHPVIDWLVRFIKRHRPVRIHTGLYDRYDLLELLEKQQVQADNRIDKTHLDIAKHALTFGDITVGEQMVPRRVVKQVSADEQLGPLLMDELHASGHSRFPVYETKQDNIVGTLYMHDLVRSKNSGLVKSVMRKQVYYLHEDQSLHDGLQAIFKTHHHLFIVVNSFEEYVGVITSEDILEAIVGRAIVDEFDEYEDLRAVAARHAKEDHQDHQNTEPKPEETKQKLTKTD